MSRTVVKTIQKISKKMIVKGSKTLLLLLSFLWGRKSIMVFGHSNVTAT